MSKTQELQAQIESKACTRCKDVLPRSREWFEKRDTKHAFDGLSSWCKPCINEAKRARWRQRQERAIVEGGEKTCTGCFKVLPRTLEYFAAKRKSSVDGFSSRCKECSNKDAKVRFYQKPSTVERMRERDDETRLGVYTHMWSPNWKTVSSDEIRETMRAARAYAYSIGCDWIADDAAQMAAIEFLQKGFCSYRFAVLKIIDRTIGSPNSTRRKYNVEIDQSLLTKIFASMDEVERQIGEIYGIM